ncbi:hypothetical protein D3C86_1036820 [compost metagenome]
MAGAHRQQVLDRHARQARIDVRRQVLRKERDDRIAEPQQAFIDGQANGARRKTFRHRVQDSRALWSVRPLPAFSHDFAVAVQDHPVQIQPGVIDVIEKSDDAIRIDPGFAGRRAEQSVMGC